MLLLIPLGFVCRFVPVGLPYLIVKYGNDLDMERVYAAVLWIVLVSIMLNGVFARIERTFVTWRAI